MARISLNPPRTLSYRLGSWYSRRRYGAMLEPGQALAHNPRVRWRVNYQARKSGYELAAGTGSGAGAGSGVYWPLARALWPPSAMTALAVTRW